MKIKHVASSKFLLLPLLLILMVQTVFADAKTYVTEAINNVSIGDINIELKEYSRDNDGNLIPMPYESVVLPGDDLTQIVRINNIARDAWIRVKLEFQSDFEFRGLDDSLVHLSSDDWKKVGDYYYALKPVAHGTSVDFMDSIHIPNDWTEAYSDESFRIVVSADAVQYENFTPDFESDDPWFGTVIEQCVHDEYDVPVAASNKSFSVEFRGGAEGFVRVGDDFFENWGQMMPGDTKEGSVKVKNAYAKNIKLYFYTETIDDADLLKRLDLTIKGIHGETIYDGKMDGVVKKTLVADLPQGEGGDLVYTVHVPEELNNAYALAKTKTKWIFEAAIDDDKDNDKNNKDNDKNNKDSSSNDRNPSLLERVQTGDLQQPIAWLMLIGGTLLILAVMLKRRTHEE